MEDDFKFELITSELLDAFFEQLTNIKPAKIEYSVDEHGEVKGYIKGRNAELLLLVATIISDRIKKITEDIEGFSDIYLKLLKEIIRVLQDYSITFEKSNEQNKKNDENSLKKFNDIFKDLDL